MALAALPGSDGPEIAQRHRDDLLAGAHERGAPLTVVTVSAMAAMIEPRRGDLIGAEAEAQTPIELTSETLRAESVGLAVARRRSPALTAIARRQLSDVQARAAGNDQLTIVKASDRGAERCRTALVAVISTL